MNIIKGLFSGFFSFLLVIVLSILGLLITVNLTVLNPDFVIRELDKLDVYSIVADEVVSRMSEGEPLISEALSDTMEDIEPWLREQVAYSIYGGLAYLKGEASLRLVFPLETVKSSLKENVRQSILESPPPKLAGLPSEIIDLVIEEVNQQIDNTIPDNFEVSESSLPSDVADVVWQAKRIIGYIGIAFKASIAAMVLLILFIALLNWWRARPISRYVGIAFVVSALACFISTLFIGDVISPWLSQPGLPVELVIELPQLISDFLQPLKIYSLGILVIGIWLTVFSFVHKTEMTF